MLSLERLSLPIICIAVGFGSGWAINGWRLSSKLADLRAEHRRVIAEVNAKSIAALEQATKKAADTQAAIQSIADTKLREMTDEIDRIRNTPAQRVYVRANCHTASVPAAPDSTGVGSGAGAELDPAYRGTLSDLKSGAIRFNKKLEANQLALAECLAR